MRRFAKSLAIAAIGLVVAAGIVAGVWLGALRLACHRAGQPVVADFGATRAVIIGDSWAAGTGLADPSKSFAHVLARTQRWDAIINAVETTGFTAAGPCGDDRSYITRVIDIPRDTSIVVVEGGLNDVDAPGLVADRASALLEAIREQAPSATTTIIGPPTVPARDAKLVLAVDTELRTAAARAGARYISTVTWEIDTHDQLHPTATGHALFARRVSSAFARQSEPSSR